MLTIDQFNTILQFTSRLAARMDPQSRVAIETLCAAIEAQAVPRPFSDGTRPEHANSWFAIETLETIAERSADPATQSGACLLLLLIQGANFCETRPFSIVARHVQSKPAARRNRRVAAPIETAAEFPNPQYGETVPVRVVCQNTIAHNDVTSDDSVEF